MAPYGDLKVNNLIYDTGSGDASRTVLSIPQLASPTFTGTPAAPTAAANTNTTQIATTAFVMTELGDYLLTSTATSTYAPKASPTFTGDVTFTGAANNVVFDASDNALEFADDAKATFGTGSDLVIKHTGSVSEITNAVGELQIKNIANSPLKLYTNNNVRVTIANDGHITTSNSISDSKGDVRSIPQLSKSSAHTIVASDSGKHSINSTGGWTFNTSTGFTAGQAITLINNSGSNQTITNTGCTMYLGGDTSSKSTLTLKGRGIATFICTASNVYYGSGAGLE